MSVISPALNDKGYDVVRVRFAKQGRKQILSIDIDRLDGKPVSIDDCAEANRLISALLDIEDLIKDPYNLEVGSPGEVRPLTKIIDFERFSGQSVKLELYAPKDGRCCFLGELIGVRHAADEVFICIKTEGPENAELELPYKNIKKASIRRVF